MIDIWQEQPGAEQLGKRGGSLPGTPKIRHCTALASESQEIPMA